MPLKFNPTGVVAWEWRPLTEFRARVINRASGSAKTSTSLPFCVELRGCQVTPPALVLRNLAFAEAARTNGSEVVNMIKASTAPYAALLLRVSLGRVLTAQTVTFKSPGK
jgi:hypothetical protein